MMKKSNDFVHCTKMEQFEPSETYKGRDTDSYYKKDYDRAMANYNEALRLNLNDILANNRGYAYVMKRDYVHADWEKAPQINPFDTDVWNNLDNLVRLRSTDH